MTYGELNDGIGVIQKVYSGARFEMKAKARAVLGPFVAEGDAFSKDFHEEMKKAGAIPEEKVIGGRAMIMFKAPDQKSKAKIEGVVSRMRGAEVKIEIKEKFTLEELSDIDIGCAEEDVFARLGFLELEENGNKENKEQEK